ncbi:hypothetical protein [Nocardia brasiliensis]|uniref:hypothetical protein n=1 Tax=Nocardia brasiliensis TaxID=37326 RepID=UPI001894F218|nr:hypothetical protein [Nocardia brasiliensis]MBF6125536.1 hypothetical protein [Nocardia brasiliensis]
MSTPEPGPAQRVVQWQADLLKYIQAVAGEHARREAALPEHGLSEDEAAAYHADLDGLAAQLEHAEQTALTAGMSPTVIAEVRDYGARGASTLQPVQAASQRADLDLAGMHADWLTVDVWHYERMASLEATRLDRIETGRWSFGANHGAAQQFARQLQRRYERVTHLANAMNMTPTEAENTWATSVENLARLHAVTVETFDELTVMAMWNTYAITDPGPAIPPFVPTHPLTGTPTSAPTVHPPPPQQMIDTARSALAATFTDTTAATDYTADPITENSAITDAVEQALPAAGADWTSEPEPGHRPPRQGAGEGIDTVPY